MALTRCGLSSTWQVAVEMAGGGGGASPSGEALANLLERLLLC
jgi:hypothetical protein